jgi:hypothetical protein
MSEPSWSDVLDACPDAEETDWGHHASAFVSAFVIPAKRDRWDWLLTKGPRKVGRDSHKLHSDLDRRTCRRVTALPAEFRRGGGGLFYDFYGAPKVVLSDEVHRAIGGRDAIFSLVPGKLAVYFFHEGELWLCRAPG